MSRFAMLLTAALAACAPISQSVTRASTLDSTLPAMRSFSASPASGPTRPNGEMVADFIDLTFMMESGRQVPAMTRFEGQITVRVEGAAPATLSADLRALVSRLQQEAGLDILLTGAEDANITVQTVPRRELTRAVPNAACFVVPRVSNWTEFRRARQTAQVDWTTLQIRERAAIFIPDDVSPQEIRDCLHEELAQALGPLNDLYRLPDSVFNDDNIHAVLTGFDMLMLRAYYAPQLANGMTREQVQARLPAILDQLNPAGRRPVEVRPTATSRDWIAAIAGALNPGTSETTRRTAAARAVAIAERAGWRGARAGFAHYAHGRLQIQNDATLALDAFHAAAREFRSTEETRIHEAHVAVQLAAFALSAGDAEVALGYTDNAIPIAARHENAALLATLLMFRAEALDLTGRASEAQVVRLDSLAWARYGFGSDQAVRTRQAEIAALNPRSRS